MGWLAGKAIVGIRPVMGLEGDCRVDKEAECKPPAQ